MHDWVSVSSLLSFLTSCHKLRTLKFFKCMPFVLHIYDTYTCVPIICIILKAYKMCRTCLWNAMVIKLRKFCFYLNAMVIKLRKNCFYLNAMVYQVEEILFLLGCFLWNPPNEIDCCKYSWNVLVIKWEMLRVNVWGHF